MYTEHYDTDNNGIQLSNFQHNNTLQNGTQFHHAERRIFIVMLSSSYI
jgi:hypothetical protein